MTLTTAPDLPFVLATAGSNDPPYLNELALEEVAGRLVLSVQRFEKCDEHADDDHNHDREGGLCFVRGYHVPIDPAWQMRNLALFVADVRPVAWIDNADDVWTLPGSPIDSTRIPADKGLAWVEENYGPLTPLYAHPPVAAESVAAPSVDHAADREGVMVPGSAYVAMTKARDKAEARVKELESALAASKHNYCNMRDGRLNDTQVENDRLRAKVERHKAALEAADLVIEHLVDVLGDPEGGSVAEALRSMRDYAATVAAVEVAPSEEAGA